MTIESSLFSVVIHKATRTALIELSGLTFKDAQEKAGSLYEVSKVFSKHGSLASGVSILVMADAAARHKAETGYWLNDDHKDVTYQCGGY